MSPSTIDNLNEKLIIPFRPSAHQSDVRSVAQHSFSSSLIFLSHLVHLGLLCAVPLVVSLFLFNWCVLLILIERLNVLVLLFFRLVLLLLLMPLNQLNILLTHSPVPP